jgi:anti-anti-sigma regulatory factor
VTSSADSERARLRVETVDDENAAWVVIHGEADIANVDGLEAALGSVDLDGAKTVTLQVSDLAFVDIAALRQLTDFARRMKQDGRTVLTSGARPALQRMAVNSTSKTSSASPDRTRSTPDSGPRTRYPRPAPAPARGAIVALPRTWLRRTGFAASITASMPERFGER